MPPNAHANNSVDSSPPATGPWSPVALRRRALAELDEAAATLHQQGHPPLTILIRLGEIALRYRALGAADLPDDVALAAVHRLPGLADFDPMAAWAADVADAGQDELVAGLESPEREVVNQRERAFAVADWLKLRWETNLAARIVNYAEAEALKEVGA